MSPEERAERLEEIVIIAEAELAISLLMGFWEPRHMALVHDVARFDKPDLLRMLKILAESNIPERMAQDMG